MAELENADLTDLHALAEEYADALARVNAPLPGVFPTEQMHEITRALLTLDGSPTEDDQRTLVYARSKLREARKVLRIHVRDPEAPSYFEIERAHNALFAELDVLVETIPPPILLELQPSSRNGLIVVRRTELASRVAALEQRLRTVEAQSRDALAHVDQPRTVVSAIHIENLRLNIGNLIKVVTTFSAELKADLIDLSWITELTTRIDELAKSLGQAVDSARKSAGRVVSIIASADKARRLAERVVDGGKALLGWVRRRLSRGSASNPQRPQVFRDIDAPWCPEMVIIPPGKFLMGSPENEDDRDDDEGPRHEVAFPQPFAVGRYPVTFEEYDRFAEDVGRALPSDQGWGRGRRPVINVLWEDAKAYAVWLNEQTGRPYRLLSEAEWEYACRAGMETRYWWGDEITSENANFGGYVGKTAEVGSYPESPWGLYDMHGNVWEWVEDASYGSYEDAPTDGTPWTRDEEVTPRVLRGGAFFDRPKDLRAASRNRDLRATLFYKGLADLRYNGVGFRVARTLSRSERTTRRSRSHAGISTADPL